MFSTRAAIMAARRRGFIAGSGMPSFAATVISRASLPNSFDLAASWRPLRCMMFLNWECPAMVVLCRDPINTMLRRADARANPLRSRDDGLIGCPHGKIQPSGAAHPLLPERRPRLLERAAEADGADLGREPALVVGLHRERRQRRWPHRGLELGARDLAQEAADRLVLGHADHRVVVARHADVGDEGGAARQHALI